MNNTVKKQNKIQLSTDLIVFINLFMNQLASNIADRKELQRAV